ncbi:MAG: Rrf2 family transcriptional regulator [Clostridia bacterium]|nr:Rrf2 family transcriptional regulator [Clostridia bacterium]
MQITSRFTIAVHIIACIEHFQQQQKVTSSFLAGSIGANPVIVRTVMSMLKEAGIISISQGKSGIRLARSLHEITFYDIYAAVDCVNTGGLFHFHDRPNSDCPVGRHIHQAMDQRLMRIQSAMEDEMKSITLANVVNDVETSILSEE